MEKTPFNMDWQDIVKDVEEWVMGWDLSNEKSQSVTLVDGRGEPLKNRKLAMAPQFFLKAYAD